MTRQIPRHDGRREAAHIRYRAVGQISDNIHQKGAALEMGAIISCPLKGFAG